MKLLLKCIFLLLSQQSFAQLAVSVPTKSILLVDNVPFTLELPSYDLGSIPSLKHNKGATNLNTLLLNTQRDDNVNPPDLASLRYQPHLAFFCRVEVKIDKAVGTPFRFRLGSVDYVDYLEGKRPNPNY